MAAEVTAEKAKSAQRIAEAQLEAIKPPKPTLYCSFCSKSQHDVKNLIAGPSTFICDECVTLCIEIINETTKAEADLKLVHDAIEAHWGPRCPDEDPECNTCRAWAYIDKVNGKTGGRRAG
ncbi:hypothetical protein G6L60_19675 [Agrobacterium tumefaciens]|nr:hypothetical protein [Agrobacterium tumefaciens]